MNRAFLLLALGLVATLAIKEAVAVRIPGNPGVREAVGAVVMVVAGAVLFVVFFHGAERLRSKGK